jgi:hypothetical protein
VRFSESDTDLINRSGAVHKDDQPGDRTILTILNLGGDALLHEADDDAITGQSQGLMDTLDAGEVHESLSDHADDMETAGQAEPDRPDIRWGSAAFAKNGRLDLLQALDLEPDLLGCLLAVAFLIHLLHTASRAESQPRRNKMRPVFMILTVKPRERKIRFHPHSTNRTRHRSVPTTTGLLGAEPLVLIAVAA